MKIFKLFSSLFFVCSFTTIPAQQNEVAIKTIQVSNSVYMLVGQGGNIGVSVGDDGVFVIDDQFARLTPKILDAIKKLNDKPIQYVVNTHYHGDHLDGEQVSTFLDINSQVLFFGSKQSTDLVKEAGSNNDERIITIETKDYQKQTVRIGDISVTGFYMNHVNPNNDDDSRSSEMESTQGGRKRGGSCSGSS